MKTSKEEKVIAMIALGADVFVFMNQGIVTYKGTEVTLGDQLFWRLVRLGVIKQWSDMRSNRPKYGWGPIRSKAIELSGIIVAEGKTPTDL